MQGDEVQVATCTICTMSKEGRCLSKSYPMKRVKIVIKVAWIRLGNRKCCFKIGTGLQLHYRHQCGHLEWVVVGWVVVHGYMSRYPSG